MADINFDNWDGQKHSDIREFIKEKIVALQDESVKTVIKNRATDGITTVYFLMTADSDEIAKWKAGYTDGDTTYTAMDTTSPYVRASYTYRDADDTSEWNLDTKITQQPSSAMVMGASNVVKFTYLVSYGGDNTDVETQAGKATVTINGGVVSDLTTKLTSNTDGTTKEYSLDLGPYLTSSENSVTLKVQNADGTKSRSWSFDISAYSLQVAFGEAYTVDQQKPKDSNWDLPIKVTGSAGELHCKVDDTELTVQSVIAGSTTNFKIDADALLAEGSHSIEAWCENTTFGFSSDHIYTNFIKKGDNDCITIGANAPRSAQQYGSVDVPYFAYLPTQEVGTVVNVDVAIISDSKTISTISQKVTVLDDHLTGVLTASASLMSTDLGTSAMMVIAMPDLNIQCQQEFAIEKGEIELTEATECKVNYNFLGKTNNDSDIDSLQTKYEDAVTSTLTRVNNWKINDNNGCDGSGFRININNKMLLSLATKFFSQDFGANGTHTGKTFAIELKTSNVVNTDAIVADCMNDDCGFRIYANRIEVKYAGATDPIVAPFPENERVRVGFVIDGTTTHCSADTGAGTVVEHDYNLGYIYIDGIVARLFEYGTSSWKQETPKDIYIGSDQCDVEPYSIRIWDKALTVTEWLNTYAYDTPNVSDKLDIATRNAVLDASGEPSMTLIQKRLPNTAIHVWEMESIPPTKKTTVNITSSSFTNPAWDGEDGNIAQASYEAGAHTTKADGTSSEGYPLPYKNLGETLPSSITIKYPGGDASSSFYSITKGITEVGETEFVDKINFASCEGVLNIVAMNMYQKILLTCAAQNNALFTKQQLAQYEANGIDGVTYRQSLSGMPEIGFRRYTIDGKLTTKYWSLFNLINNKYSGSIYGLTKKGKDIADGKTAEIWEVDENVNFFNQEFTENTIENEKLVPSTGVNDLSGYTTLYYCRVPKKSDVTGNGNGVATDVTQVAQANIEIANLRRFHNWVWSLNPWVAEQYKAEHGSYATLSTPWTSSSGSIFTYDNPAYRRARFFDEYSQYLNSSSACFYFVFCTWIIGMDSMDKNMSIVFDDTTAENPKASLGLRDTDSWGRFNNTGVLSFPYYVEWGDTYKKSTGEVGQVTGCDANGKSISSVDGASQVFNGAMSGLWALVSDCLGTQIQSMYQSMRSAGLNADTIMEMWDGFRKMWCDALYNYDAVKRYASTGNLTMAYGDKWALIRDFLVKRTRYMDSKYDNSQTGNHTTMRFNSVPTGVWMEHSMPIYASFIFGSTTYVKERNINTGTTAYLATPSSIKTFDNATCYINDADLVTGFGGYTLDSNGNKVKGGIEALGQVAFTQSDLSNLSKVEEFVMAYTAANPNTYQQAEGFSAYSELKNFKRLKKLIMTYVEGYNGIMDLNSPVLKQLDLTGTQCAGLTFNAAASDVSVTVPNTIKSLVIKAEGVDTYSIVSGILNNGAALTTLTISETLNWTAASASVVVLLAKITNCNVKGKINITNEVNAAAKKAMMDAFGDIDNESNPLYITYPASEAETCTLSVTGDSYIIEPGKATYDLVFTPDTFNNFTDIVWELSANAAPYATIDEKGTLTVTTMPAEDSDMVVNQEMITVTATLKNGDTTVSAASKSVGLFKLKYTITVNISYNSMVTSRATEIYAVINSGTQQTIPLTDNTSASFKVAYKDIVQITFQHLEDAKNLASQTFIATSNRTLSLTYNSNVSELKWLMSDGSEKEFDDASESDKENIVGMICAFSLLQQNNACCVIPIEYLTRATSIPTYSWGDSSYDFTCLTDVSSQSKAATQVDGNELCEAAYQENSAACSGVVYCRQLEFVVNGGTQNAFMPAWGQMYLISLNQNVIKEQIEATFGVTPPAFNKGTWWTIAEYKDAYGSSGVCVKNGEIYMTSIFNGDSKSTTYSILPLIAY